ncbi:1,4-dihydroxy-2-naphthoate polyprenyltransferase [Corynebacterium sp. CCM 9185]|uniref:1,4-dihydroxy-2-naphthoate octaprenyltransferase n=1 Tax=Corynebacterium marambiense TaxID=2765364 RepID=A0ABS0VRZ0_9CORY|nr:1,4-dihydroxy-2-naphthoate polyprenyltransferase [Corynebacterium marambiense]MBI8999534.1 1,4-dihydroxy-2-naphthoate polyprenyltransferase [Corynebacterium marambiense]MCK7662372.1 1,4-dihydroxy-2-naphthoate polyprenyltransferase [Corynebacterium marambiense]MCX7541657.1 1,4-dihydroxy-2-naphthoate polyprenyltransferase [Corynebacterium marambiense]
MAESTTTPRPRPTDWLEGARPHTWPNAFAPVIAGTGAAAATEGLVAWKAIVAVVVALALIIGVNYANDYSDGIRGTDDDRSGPLRLTGSGLARPKHVRSAAFAAFGVAGISGLVLAATSAWWLIFLGAACIAGAWFYTGGKNPYGYRGLGEVAVFVFFGLVAVLGTEFTQAGRITWTGLAAAVAVGCFSSAVNLANNLRDIPTDRRSGKVTLAVRLGDRGTRRLWVVLAGAPYLLSLAIAAAHLPALAAFIALPVSIAAAEPVVQGRTGRDLIQVLGATGKAMLLWSIVTASALIFS